MADSVKKLPEYSHLVDIAGRMREMGLTEAQIDEILAMFKKFIEFNY